MISQEELDRMIFDAQVQVHDMMKELEEKEVDDGSEGSGLQQMA